MLRRWLLAPLLLLLAALAAAVAWLNLRGEEAIAEGSAPSERHARAGGARRVPSCATATCHSARIHLGRWRGIGLRHGLRATASRPTSIPPGPLGVNAFLARMHHPLLPTTSIPERHAIDK